MLKRSELKKSAWKIVRVVSRSEQILCRAKKKKNAFFNSESTVLSIFHAYNYLIKLFYNFSREVELCKRVLVKSSFPCLGSFVKPGQVCCTVHKSRCKGKHISDPSIVQQFIRRISNYLKPGFKSWGLAYLIYPDQKWKQKIPFACSGLSSSYLEELARCWHDATSCDVIWWSLLMVWTNLKVKGLSITANDSFSKLQTIWKTFRFFSEWFEILLSWKTLAYELMNDNCPIVSRTFLSGGTPFQLCVTVCSYFPNSPFRL